MSRLLRKYNSAVFWLMNRLINAIRHKIANPTINATIAQSNKCNHFKQSKHRNRTEREREIEWTRVNETTKAKYTPKRNIESIKIKCNEFDETNKILNYVEINKYVLLVNASRLTSLVQFIIIYLKKNILIIWHGQKWGSSTFASE